MEGSNKVTKGQLLEMIRKEIIFQDKKELLENKISSINDELYVLTEGREGKKKKEDDIDEGLFQNIGRGIGKAFGGAKEVGAAVQQKYQAGSDKKSLNYVISDIKEKEAELADSKKQYQNLTGKAYSPKTASTATAVPRNQQGLVKTAPAKKAATKKVVSQPTASAQAGAQAVAPQRNTQVAPAPQRNVQPAVSASASVKSKTKPIRKPKQKQSAAVKAAASKKAS